tara:strand:- start:481 stop:639 length:159 start_codon:yes stop_codon:yes gene_type:complete
MEKIKSIVTSPLFVCGSALVIGITLVIESHPMYAGIAFGFGLAKFLNAFKTL